MSTETTCTESNETDVANPPCAPELRSVRPEWHSRDDGEAVALSVALPGVLRKDLEISARENQVSLRAPRSFPPESGVAYELTLRLSRDLDPASTKALLANGVLELHFSRREEAKARRIAVEG